MSNALEKAKQWVSSSAIDQESKNIVEKLIQENNLSEIEECFYKDLEFGTGGMRAVLGEGTNRLNKFNIRKASYALGSVLKEQNPNGGSVVISYDSRRFSFEFAQYAAGVFASLGLKALIYNRLNPVPLCSFAIRHHKALAGVMVTASHNPPEYNGFKVFWSDGAQVTPPNDKIVIDKFNSINDYAEATYIDFEKGLSEGSIEWIGEETEDAYHAAIKASSLGQDMCQEKGPELKIVYTALHGTGYTPCTTALTNLGMTNVLSVPEQEKPDGNFPTVSSPNPENPEALALAVALLEREGADLALGTDPDTDRVGIAYKHEGETVYLNGNQIGILMLHYLLTQYKSQNKLPSDPYFVKTIVTTNLQEKIAKAFGVEHFNTLTGFKWICGHMNTIEKNSPEKNFLFATEESFGYLSHQNVRDKDGVSSVALMCEIALYYKLKGMNLSQALDTIYEEYGFSHESLLSLNYYGKEGAEKIARIMEYFRSQKSAPIAGFVPETCEDYKLGAKTHIKTGDQNKLDYPESNVLGFTFENTPYKLYLRPSGTEPKIKFYIMIQENDGSLDDKKAKAMKVTETFLSFIKQTCDKI